jgi:hypothetical protein
MTAVIEKATRAKTVKAVTERLNPLTLGAATDKMWALREEKRLLAVEEKRISTELAALETTIFGLMDAQDTRKAEGKKAGISIGEATVGNVEDWDALWPYIVKNKYFHLVQKRVSDPGLRELWEKGKVVPGVQPFTKRTLSVRSL